MTMAARTFLYISFGGHILSFLMYLYQGLEFLGYKVEVGFSIDITKQLFKVFKPMHIPLAKYELELLHILTTPEKYICYILYKLYILEYIQNLILHIL